MQNGANNNATMALFVPQWPSDDEADSVNVAGSVNIGRRVSSNGISTFKSENKDDGHAVNGAGPEPGDAGALSHDMAAGAPSGRLPLGGGKGVDGIELTHDPVTGSVSVSNAEAAADAAADEAGQQCQLWSATLAKGDSSEVDDNITGSVEINPEPAAFGDIWSTEAFALDVASPLRDLLDSGGYALADLLAQDELLQELRACEARLVEYFDKVDAVAGLVECLMVEVPYLHEKCKGGKERWCSEEEERRRRRRELREQQVRDKRTNDDGDIDISCSKSTVYDASSPKQEDALAVEAKWNSPPKAERGGFHLRPEEEHAEVEEEKRTPGEEYDMRFLRYPYMACEVLCSEVGTTLDVLVDGYVEDVINDEEDSLLDHSMSERGMEMKEVRFPREMKEVKMEGLEDVNVCYDVGSSGAGIGLKPRVPVPPLQPPLPPAPSPSSVSLVAEPAKSKSSALPKRRILDLFFSPLLDTPLLLLDDRRAGYFEKILNVLFRKRGQAMSDYMNSSLIVTSKSTEMVRKVLASVDVEGAMASAVGGNRKRVESSSSYVSLSQGTSSPSFMEENTGNNSTIPNNINNHDCNLNSQTICKFPSPDAPPMLMCALMDHIHSHSLMHVVQRLLLPSPMRQKQQQDAKAKSDSAPPSAADCASNDDKIYTTDGGKIEDEENLHSEVGDCFMSALSQMNGGGLSGDGVGGGDQEDEDEELDDEDDPMSHIFQCDWSTQEQKARMALELLLRRLEGGTESFLFGYGYPVGYDVDCCRRRKAHESGESEMRITKEKVDEVTVNDNGESVAIPKERPTKISQQGKEAQEEAELALSCSQHASEILVAIVQNSSLDSPVSRILSSDSSLRRMIDLILPPSTSRSTGDAMDAVDFVAHESTMTCAIAVLESLVLQLGGYGTVASLVTAADDATCAVSTAEGDSELEENGQYLQAEFELQPPPSTSTKKAIPIPLPIKNSSATTSSLLLRVPSLLTRLSALLTHPVTSTWLAPSQYSPSSLRPLLGTSRLKLLRLIESLVLLGDPKMDEELEKSDVLEKCIGLFWQFEWCSMLHQSVANFLVHVFEGGESRSGLQRYFLGKCNLLERLMDSFDNESQSCDKAVSRASVPITAAGEQSGAPVVDVGAFDGSKFLCSPRNREEMSVNEDVMEDSNETRPRYGEVVLSMKSFYQNGRRTPIESDLGRSDGKHSNGEENDAAEGDNDDVDLVSEDDVDSALEKECQERGDVAVTDMSSKDEDGNYALVRSERFDNVLCTSITPPQGISGPDFSKMSVRKGYMGHIIIICQALVHACNNSDDKIDITGRGDGNSNEKEGDDNVIPSLNSPPSLYKVSAMSSLETLTVQCPLSGDPLVDASCCNSKKRKDRSPVRDGDENIKRFSPSPNNDDNNNDDGRKFSSSATRISEVLPSPVKADLETNIAQLPSNDIDCKVARHKVKLHSSIDNILRHHPLYARWRKFVVSVLSSEMSVQSTPLGGGEGKGHNPMGAVTSSDLEEIRVGQMEMNDDGDSDFLGLASDQNNGPSSCAIGGSSVGGGRMAVGEIDMDENDLDIAASMMEALSLPPSAMNSGCGGSGAHPAGHSRRRGVIGGGSLLGNETSLISSKGPSSGSGGIANFGSVIQRPGGFKDYVYDDPLGGIHPFDNCYSSDDEYKSNPGGFNNNSEDDGFMSDAMVVSRDGVVVKQGSGGDTTGANMKKSSQSSNDEAGDDDDDDDVPVIDLFAGTFDANFANFDAFESSMAPEDISHTSSMEKEINNSGSSEDTLFTAVTASSGVTAADDDPFKFSRTPLDCYDNPSANHIKNGGGPSHRGGGNS